jgi:hypothetical protein
LRSVMSGFGNQETEVSVFPSNMLGKPYVPGTTVVRNTGRITSKQLGSA